MSDTDGMLEVRAANLEAELLGFIKSCMSMQTEGGTTEPIGGTLMVFSIPSKPVSDPRLLQIAYTDIEKGFMVLREALKGPKD